MDSTKVRGHGVRFEAFDAGNQVLTGTFEFITHLVIAVVSYIAVLIPFYFIIATRFEEMGVEFNVSDTVKSFVGMATRMLDPVEKVRILESMNQSDREKLRQKEMMGNKVESPIDALDKKVEVSNSAVRSHAYVKLLQIVALGACLVAVFSYLTRWSYKRDVERMSSARAPESIGSMIRSNAVLALVILLTQALFSIGFATWVRIVDKSALVRRCVKYLESWASGSLVDDQRRSSASSVSPPPTLSSMRSGGINGSEKSPSLFESSRQRAATVSGLRRRLV